MGALPMSTNPFSRTRGNNMETNINNKNNLSKEEVETNKNIEENKAMKKDATSTLCVSSDDEMYGTAENYLNGSRAEEGCDPWRAGGGITLYRHLFPRKRLSGAQRRKLKRAQRMAEGTWTKDTPRYGWEQNVSWTNKRSYTNTHERPGVSGREDLTVVERGSLDNQRSRSARDDRLVRHIDAMSRSRNKDEERDVGTWSSFEDQQRGERDLNEFEVPRREYRDDRDDRMVRSIDEMSRPRSKGDEGNLETWSRSKEEFEVPNRNYRSERGDRMEWQRRERDPDAFQEHHREYRSERDDGMVRSISEISRPRSEGDERDVGTWSRFEETERRERDHDEFEVPLREYRSDLDDKIEMNRYRNERQDRMGTDPYEMSISRTERVIGAQSRETPHYRGDLASGTSFREIPNSSGKGEEESEREKRIWTEVMSRVISAREIRAAKMLTRNNQTAPAWSKQDCGAIRSSCSGENQDKSTDASSNTAFTALRVAVTHKNHPNILLSQDQAEMIQDKLIEALDETALACSNPPQFVSAKWTAGILWIVCANEESKIWLHDVVGQLKNLWDEADLIVVEYRDISRRAKVLVWIPEMVEVERVVTRLKLQNPGLGTEEWQLLSRKVEVGPGQSLAFSMEPESFKKLERAQFKAYYKLEKVNFRVI